MTASFDEECSSSVTTACTIPPQAFIDLNVNVWAF